MVRDLTCRRILITGASSGIGRALAEQAALEGACVTAAARSTDRLDELARGLAARGAEVLTVTADVTSAADRQRLLDTVGERFGGLDVLINNAGVAGWGPFATSSETVLRQIMEVNFFAPAELIRLAIPVLTQGKQPAIVNIASLSGRRAMPSWTEYSASKFALCGLTEALRGEMARFDIDVLLVLPGLTRSELPRHLVRDEGRVKLDFANGQPPEAVAARVLAALRRNCTETAVGRDAFWILGLNRYLPRLVDRLLTRRVQQLSAP
jgi:short-subunit dehydrogenase